MVGYNYGKSKNPKKSHTTIVENVHIKKQEFNIIAKDVFETQYILSNLENNLDQIVTININSHARIGVKLHENVFSINKKQGCNSVKNKCDPDQFSVSVDDYVSIDDDDHDEDIGYKVNNKKTQKRPRKNHESDDDDDFDIQHEEKLDHDEEHEDSYISRSEKSTDDIELDKNIGVIIIYNSDKIINAGDFVVKKSTDVTMLNNNNCIEIINDEYDDNNDMFLLNQDSLDDENAGSNLADGISEDQQLDIDTDKTMAKVNKFFQLYDKRSDYEKSDLDFSGYVRNGKYISAGGAVKTSGKKVSKTTKTVKVVSGQADKSKPKSQKHIKDVDDQVTDSPKSTKKSEPDLIVRKEVMLNTSTEDMNEIDQCKYNEILQILKYKSVTLFQSQKSLNILTDFTSSREHCIFNINNPGTGKTISVINYLFHINKLISLKRIAPIKIRLLTFAKGVFYNELMRFSDFNYVPISAHMAELTDDEKKTVGKNMYFESYGYRQFASRVLTITDEQVFNQYINEYSHQDPMKVLFSLEEKGIVKINHDFVQTFNDTYVVVDECQRLQNSSWVNHYGYALVCIRDYTDAKFVMLSATMFNIKSVELVLFQRMLKNYYPFEKCITPEGELIPDWREKILPLFKGTVFYSGEANKRFTPKQVYVGRRLKFTDANGQTYDVDKDRKYYFVKMSPTMALYHKSNLSQMQYAAHLFLMKISTKLGDKFLYTKEDIRWLMSNKQVLHEIGLDVDIQIDQNVNGVDDAIRLSGPMLRKKNLEKYSPKLYALLVEFIDNKILLDEGKALVITYEVRFPGLLFIESVLKENGLVILDTLPNQSSICLACLKTKAQHDVLLNKLSRSKMIRDDINNMTPNERLAYFRSKPAECYHFMPIYFETVHAYMTNVERAIQKFNSHSNMHGVETKVMIGSYVLAVAYSFMWVKHMFVVSVPYSITFLQQLEKRPVRAKSLDGLVEQVVYMYIMCMTYDDPNLLTREELSYIDHHYNYAGIKEVIDALRDIASDKQMYKSTQSRAHIEKLKTAEIVDSTYYALNFAQEYISEIVFLIKQLFTVYKILNIDNIISLIQKKSCYLSTETNTAYLTKRDICCAMFVLMNSPHQVNFKYLEKNVGVAVLYKTNCNVVINDNIVCKIDHLRNGIYRLIPKTTGGFSMRRPEIEFAMNSNLTTVFRFKDQDFNKTNTMTIENIEYKLSQYSEEFISDFLMMFMKEQLIHVIKTAIVNWSTISETYKKFIYTFVKSREVFLRRHLPGISTMVPADAPCAYLYGGMVHYYDPKCVKILSPAEQLEAQQTADITKPRFMKVSLGQTQEIAQAKQPKKIGCWRKSAIEVFKEIPNSMKYIGYFNNLNVFTLHSPREPVNLIDNRFNVTGTKCPTLPKNVIAYDVLANLFKIHGRKNIIDFGNIKSPEICARIAELMISAELIQWNSKQSQLKAKKKPNSQPMVFERYIYLIEMVKRTSSTSL